MSVLYLFGGFLPLTLHPSQSAMAPLWENCVDIDFGHVNPPLSMLSVHKFVRTLDVKETELMGLSAVFESRNQVIRLTFNSKASCEDFLRKHAKVHEVTIDGKDLKIAVKDSNIVEKFVKITGIPYTLDLGIVKMRLREFGTVFDVHWDRYRATGNEFFYPVLSTWLIVRMSIDKEIPSYLNIGSYRPYLKYDGQVATCKHCDNKEHFGKDCPTQKKKKGVVTMADPPVQAGGDEPPVGEAKVAKKTKWNTREDEGDVNSPPESPQGVGGVPMEVNDPQSQDSSPEIPAPQPSPSIIPGTQPSASQDLDLQITYTDLIDDSSQEKSTSRKAESSTSINSQKPDKKKKKEESKQSKVQQETLARLKQLKK